MRFLTLGGGYGGILPDNQIGRHMSVNLVNLVMDQLGDSALGQLSDMLGEDRSNTQKAAQAAVPGLLGSLVKMASSKDDARGLLNVLTNASDLPTGGLGAMLGGDRTNLEDTGNAMLKGLLGGNLGSLAGAISGFSGLSNTSSKSMLGMLAPMVIGLLKRNLLKSGGLNIENLMSTLMSQKSNVAAAMPSGFQNQLQSAGLNALADLTQGAGATASAVRQGASSAARETTSAVRETAAASGGGMRRFLIPALIVAALAILAFNLFGNRGSQLVEDAANAAAGTVESATEAAGNAVESATNAVGEAASNATEAAGNAANAATEAAGNAANAAGEAAGNAANAAGNAVQNAFADLSGLAVGDINVGERMSETFANTTNALEGISDEASAEAALPALSEAAENLEGLAETAQQLPAEGLSTLSEAASTAMSQVQSLLDKAYAIPGVEGILEPVISRLMDAISTLTS